MWKRRFRQDSITSFIIIVGVVDAVMGGVGNYGSLFLTGVGTLGAAMAWRWWRSRSTTPPQPSPPSPVVQRNPYLLPEASCPPLSVPPTKRKSHR